MNWSIFSSMGVRYCGNVSPVRRSQASRYLRAVCGSPRWQVGRGRLLVSSPAAPGNRAGIACRKLGGLDPAWYGPRARSGESGVSTSSIKMRRPSSMPNSNFVIRNDDAAFPRIIPAGLIKPDAYRARLLRDLIAQEAPALLPWDVLVVPGLRLGGWVKSSCAGSAWPGRGPHRLPAYQAARRYSFHSGAGQEARATHSTGSARLSSRSSSGPQLLAEGLEVRRKSSELRGQPCFHKVELANQNGRAP